MSRFLGIDPGTKGALALYCPAMAGPPGFGDIPAIMNCFDIPTQDVTVGGKLRQRVDRFELKVLLQSLGQPTRIVVEKVSGSQGQGAASGFEFGYTVGCVHQALTDLDLPFDWVTPGQWKRTVKAPADKKAAAARCDELFPQFRSEWYVPDKRNTRKKQYPDVVRPDRAEAALLAYWASLP